MPPSLLPLLLAVVVALARGAAGAAAPFDPTTLTSMAQLRPMSDDQLAAVFASGQAIVPSQEPPYNATGQPVYDFCVGRTFFNAFTPNSSVARGVWPQGTENFINNLAERVWWGKIFYNNGDNPEYTTLWNVLASNKTVGLTAVAYKNATSPFGDGKPSVFIDYSQMEGFVTRSFLDEVRYINNNIWVGRVYSTDTRYQQKAFGKGKKDAFYAGLRAAANTALLDFLNWQGVLGPGSSQGVVNGGYYYIGNFALECAGPRTSKMRYLAPTYLDALLGVKAGFLPADFRLPKLKKESDEGAITGPGFPASSESSSGYFPKLRLWPWRFSDLRIMSNLTQTVPFKGEAIIGDKALYPITKQGMDAWRASPNVTGWVPTDAQQAAVKEIDSNKALAIAESVVARGLVAGEAWPIAPGLPVDDNPPMSVALPVCDWAVDAISAAHAAAAAAKAANASDANPLAAAINEARYGAMLKVSVVEDAASLAASTVLAPRYPPDWNATKWDGVRTALAALKQNATALPLKGTTVSLIKGTNNTVNKTLPAWTLPDVKAGVNWTQALAQVKAAALPTKWSNGTVASVEWVGKDKLG